LLAEHVAPQHEQQQVADGDRDGRDDRDRRPVAARFGDRFTPERERQDGRPRQSPESAHLQAATAGSWRLARPPYRPGQWRATNPELSTDPACQRDAYTPLRPAVSYSTPATYM